MARRRSTRGRDSNAPGRPASRMRRAAAWLRHAGRVILDEAFAIGLICDAALGSFHHQAGLASVHGQEGIGVPLSAAIFDISAMAFLREARKNQKAGIYPARGISIPSFGMIVAVGFTVAANLATASPGFWGWTFAAAPAVTLGLIIYIRDNRATILARRVTELAAAGSGTGTGTGGNQAGGTGNPVGNPRPNQDDGTGGNDGNPDDDGQNQRRLSLITVGPRGETIPGGCSIPKGIGAADPEAWRMLAAASAAFAAANGAQQPTAQQLALTVRKGKSWVLDARAAERAAASEPAAVAVGEEETGS
jgi:hypothetical protein